MRSDRRTRWERAVGGAYSVADLRSRARKRLPRLVFDYIDGAADQELTALRNVAAFSEIEILPRMLRPTPDCDVTVEIFGERLALPVLITPTGFTGIIWPRGEAVVARAAAEAGTIMVVSAASSLSLEEIAKASPGPKWFQQFIYRDRDVTLDLAKRAAAAGYKALVLTVDVQAPGNRYRDLRNGFTVPPRFRLASGFDMMRRFGWLRQMATQPQVSFPNFKGYGPSGVVSIAQWLNSLIDPTVTWSDLEWMRRNWKGPLVLKGVMHPMDARRALDIGVDAIMVSNHGGRQLDTEPATVDVLPGIAEAVDGRVPVIIDGGIRRGSDILKCRALGALCCLIGRPYLWGLGAGGEAGVARMFTILKDELERALAQGGWNHIADVGRDDVVLRRDFPWPPQREEEVVLSSAQPQQEAV